MSTKTKLICLLLIFASVGIAGLLFLFTADIAVLNPMGLIADKQRNLLVTATLLMLIVVVPVILITFAIAWKYRASNHKAKYEPEWSESWLAELAWWGVPCLIILVLAVINWKGCHELDPFRPIVTQEKPLRIQVVALQWKWLFIYPEQQIATVNFFQIPEKTPIAFEITADAPMNSFWIPRLAGQVYAMPGMRSKLHLMANGPGNFRGSSANLSGKGFAGMTFVTQVSSREEFDQWIDSVRGSGAPLNLESYRELVKPSEYQPATSYLLQADDLFGWIIMKYMMPMDGMNHDQ